MFYKLDTLTPDFAHGFIQPDVSRKQNGRLYKGPVITAFSQQNHGVHPL